MEFLRWNSSPDDDVTEDDSSSLTLRCEPMRPRETIFPTRVSVSIYSEHDARVVPPIVAMHIPDSVSIELM